MCSIKERGLETLMLDKVFKGAVSKGSSYIDT